MPPAPLSKKLSPKRGRSNWDPLPPLPYLVEGFLPIGKLAVMVAYGGSGKTWVLTQMGLSVAEGAPFFLRPTTKAKVLLLDYEQGDYETQRRLVGLHPEPLDGFDVLDLPELAMTDPKFLPELEALILSESYGLVLIDSLAAGSRGGISENDSRFAAPLMGLKRLAAKLSVSVVVLHHTRKLRQAEGTLEEEADPRMAARGTGAIFGAVDVMWLLQSGTPDGTAVHTVKSRSGKPAETFFVTLKGDAPSLCVWEVTTRATKRRAKLLKDCETLIKAVTQRPGLSANELFKLLGGGRGKVLSQVKLLEEEKVLRREGDGLYLAGTVVVVPPKKDEPL